MSGKPKSDGKHASKPAIQFAVIIETPSGSRNKFKYDPTAQTFKLSKVMPEGMVFPYDFGYLPSTKGGDGDPLDVLVLTDAPLFCGCSVDSRLIGVIEAEQEEDGKKRRNDRLVAVATQSLLYSQITRLDQLTPVVLEQIEQFFANYQRVRGVKFTILGHSGPERGLEIIQSAAPHKAAA